jgi:methyl-accepting chemotaxis protein
MAHIAKYKSTAVGHMLAHYRRDPSCYERDNIDVDRLGRDFEVDIRDDGRAWVGTARPNWDTVKERLDRVNEAARAEGRRATRKDAVVLADLVVTLPEDVRPKDEGAFFRYAYEWMAQKVGAENLMGGFVHRDEVRTRTVTGEDGRKVVERTGEPVRDHMHVPFTPILDGRFNFKRMCPRSFYQSMHKDLGDYLEKRLGYRPSIELDAETRAQRVYTARTKDIDAVRDAVEEAVLAPARREAAGARAAADAAERDRVRIQVKLGAITAEVGRKQAVAADLDGRIDEKTAEIDGLDGRKAQILDEIQAETARLEGVQQLKRAAEEKGQELKSRAEQARERAAQARGRAADLAGEVERERDRAGELAAAVERERERAGELDRNVGIARDRVGRLERAVERAREAIRRVLETLRTVPAAVAVAMGHRSPSAAAFRAAQAAEAAGVPDAGVRVGHVPSMAALRPTEAPGEAPVEDLDALMSAKVDEAELMNPAPRTPTTRGLKSELAALEKRQDEKRGNSWSWHH